MEKEELKEAIAEGLAKGLKDLLRGELYEGIENTVKNIRDDEDEKIIQIVSSCNSGSRADDGAGEVLYLTNKGRVISGVEISTKSENYIDITPDFETIMKEI